MFKSKEQGFTLLELIIVLVILGILATTAAPRFFTFREEGKVALLNNFASAMQTGLSIVNTKAIIQGQESSSGLVTLDDNSQIDVAYGYPTLTYGDLDDEIEKLNVWLNADIYNGIDVIYGSLVPPDNALIMARSIINDVSYIQFFFVSDAKAGNVAATFQCRVDYQNATLNSAPIIDVISDAC